MPDRPLHGRRRAAPVKVRSVQDGRHWAGIRPPTPKDTRIGRRLGTAAVSAGLIALAAIPAAHAASDHLSGAANSASPAEAYAEQPAVSAAADAALAFVGSGVTSAPGPGAGPAAGLHATGTPGPANPQAQGSSGLRPPLASLTVTSPYGYRVNPLTGAGRELHTGIDFAGSCATAVFAAGSGTVTEAGWSQYGGGNRIVVDHGGGIRTTYNHLASIGVSVGQQVAQGAQIAGVGTTGNSTGCHLHFEVMVNGQTVNPAPFI